MVKLLAKFQSRLTAAISVTATAIVLDSVTDIPAVPFIAVIGAGSNVEEAVLVTAITTATKSLTVTRAQRSTTAVAHGVHQLFHHSEVDLADLGFFEVWETAGVTGRPLESKLITDVLLGDYANGIKGYVDCNDSGGSTGLLSGVNGEIRLPNAAGRGAYFALEGEVVFQTNSAITPYGSTAGFLHLGITPAGIADFQDDGVFMSVWGLTNEANHLLSLDYHTLRCDFVVGGGHLTKYLVLSLAENYIYHDFSALGNAENILKLVSTSATPTYADGYGAFEIDFSISGASGNHVNVTSTWLNIGAAATITEYAALHTDGFYDAGGTLTGARLSWGKYTCQINSNPLTNSLWNLNFVGANSEIDAIFYVNDADLALGYQAGTPTRVAVGSIPFFYTGGGSLRYIYLYADADAD